jgi:hypothetical protein
MKETKYATCHPDRKLLAKGLCCACYNKIQNAKPSRKARNELYKQSGARQESLRKYNNKPERKEHLKEYFSSENGKARHNAATSKYNRSEHGKPVAKAAQKKYQQSEHGKERNRIYLRDKYANDIQFRLSVNLRNRLRAAIKGNSKKGSAVYDLGCTIEELKLRLESMWLEGMSWDNYTHKGWHIDHIKPLSSFDLTDPEQLKEACHYTNLQPLWALDNLKKSDS